VHFQFDHDASEGEAAGHAKESARDHHDQNEREIVPSDALLA
jgi:hypothetical protein